MKPLYCITAINKLTRERETVSAISTSTEVLKDMRKAFLRTPARKRTHIYPIISVSQQKLF